MNRPLKNKTRPKSSPDSQLKKPSSGQGGGVSNYDGTANTNAGTPSPERDNYFDTTGSKVED